MYTQEAINILNNRIGWSDNSDLPIAIDTENKTSDSNKYFDSFHKLATVANIFSTVEESNLEELKFNEYLLKVREQAVLSALTSVLDKSPLYIEATDYSSIITEKVRLFDDVIGYTVAIKMVELFISSSRSNLAERNSKMSYQSLKVELEGAKNDNGHFVARGLLYWLQKSVKDAQEIIFPEKIIIDGTAQW